MLNFVKHASVIKFMVAEIYHLVVWRTSQGFSPLNLKSSYIISTHREIEEIYIEYISIGGKLSHQSYV